MKTPDYSEKIKNFCTAEYIGNDIALINDARTLRIKEDKQLEGLMLVLFVKAGYMYMEINNEIKKISPRHILVCRPGHVLSSPSYSDDFCGHAILLTMRYSQSILATAGNIWNYLISIDSDPVIEIPKSIHGLLLTYHQLLLCEVKNHDNIYRDEVVQLIVRAMLCSLINEIRKKEKVQLRHFLDIDGNFKGPTQSLTLFHNFIDILVNEKCVERKIDYYAQRLCVSSKYLSTVCRQVSNRTAHDWISDTIANGIISHLRYSTLSIKEISVKYGFTSLAFFSKYVKSRFGESPSEVRKRKPTTPTS